MPYIRRKERPSKDYYISDLAKDISHIGDLNYIITSLLHHYINKNGLSYRTLNESIGVLEAAKLELYRTIIAPYEENKRQEHGDIIILRGSQK